MSEFRSYRILLKMRSPIVMAEFPPHFDGLIFEAIRQRMFTSSNDDVREAMKKVLAYNAELNVFHASSLSFGITEEKGVCAVDYNRVDVLDERKISASMYASPSKRAAYPSVILAGGPTKKRMSTRPAYAAPYAVFEFKGDAKKICELLQNAVVGVGYDAQNADMGSFLKEEIECIPLEIDRSLINEKGLPARCLPVLDNQSPISKRMAKAAIYPPYYDVQSKVWAVIPERYSVINLNSI